mgnify:CR=1 FL=1
MKYTQIQRKPTDGFITIGEYIQETNPRLYEEINMLKITLILQEPIETFVSKLKDVTETVLTAADISGADKLYQYLMQERPKPGRGGLLPGEGDEAFELHKRS